MIENQWSGTTCDTAPDTCWIDDKTGEHVNVITGKRTPTHPPSKPSVNRRKKRA